MLCNAKFRTCHGYDTHKCIEAMVIAQDLHKLIIAKIPAYVQKEFSRPLYLLKSFLHLIGTEVVGSVCLWVCGYWELLSYKLFCIIFYLYYEFVASTILAVYYFCSLTQSVKVQAQFRLLCWDFLFWCFAKPSGVLRTLHFLMGLPLKLTDIAVVQAFKHFSPFFLPQPFPQLLFLKFMPNPRFPMWCSSYKPCDICYRTSRKITLLKMGATWASILKT